MLSRILLCTAVLTVAAAPSRALAQTAPDGDAAALAAIEQRLVKAWLAGDGETVASLLAPDWTVIDFAGRTLTRAQVLDEGFASKERKIESGSIDEVKVRLFGDTAVVTGRSTFTGSYKGERMTVVQRFTDVFVRVKGGRWQVVASQGTQIAP